MLLLVLLVKITWQPAHMKNVIKYCVVLALLVKMMWHNLQ